MGKKPMKLGDRVTALEDLCKELVNSVDEWSIFITDQYLKQGIQLHKHKNSDKYFKLSLSETHKRTFNELESISLKIKQLFKKVNPRVYKYK